MYIRIEEKKEPDDEELKRKRTGWMKMMMMKTTQKGKERHLRAGQGGQGRQVTHIGSDKGGTTYYRY